ncbi:MAG: hypothetical protein D6748_07700 [Calditrichaeota bacterium]|nr:MAG: hypothetical protein D6748_07700 [Calditrichota bacterium]
MGYRDKDYFESQLEAIQKLYQKLSENGSDQVTIQDAIITWFSDGYAETFRNEYLKNNTLVTQ